MRATSTRGIRRGAIKASTVFAATVAIVAGLIGALLFQKVILGRKATAGEIQPTTKPMRELTVTVYNLTVCPIQASHIKKLKLTDEQYNEVIKKFNPTGTRQMLVGDQPVSRIPHSPIKAEEPIFEDQLDPLHFPTTIGERLRPGKRAVIIDVPAGKAMVQVGDYVDIMGTLMHDALGPGGATTACIASGRVIARYGTIVPVCCPADPSAPTRSFTIEVTPCEFGLIELARTLGASFALSINPRPPADEKDDIRKASTTDDTDDNSCCAATVKDLERIFRIPERPQKKEQRLGAIELISGTTFKQPYTYTPPEETPAMYQKSKAPETKFTTPKSPITPSSGK